MADDETIVIRVNAAQGEAALKALGSAGIQAGKDIETVGTSTSGSTDKLAAFGAKLFGLTKIAGTFGEVIRQVGNNVHFESDAAKEATTATADLFTAIGSLDAPGVGAALGKIIGNLEAMREGIDETTLSLGAMANAADAKNFAGILKIQGDLVAGHEAETAALNRKAEALTREIATQTEAGGVQKYVRDAVQETLEAYEKAGEAVPPLLAQQAAQLGIVTRSQQDAAKSAQELEEAGVKSAEERAKAEAKAAEEVVAALEKQRVALDDAVKKADEALAAAQKNTDAAEAAQFDAPSGDPSGAPSGATDPRLAEMEKLRLTMAELNALPAQTPEQVVQLAEAQDSYAKLNTQIKKFNFGLGESGTLLGQVSAADAELNAQRDRAIALYERQQSLQDEALDRLEQEEGGYGRLSDAMQEFVDVGLKAGDNLSGTFSDAGAAASETGDAVEFLAETADGAASSLEDVADAAGAIGDEAKKGAEKGKEGLDKLTEGFTQAIPLAEQLRGILQEIVMLGSQADI